MSALQSQQQSAPYLPRAITFGRASPILKGEGFCMFAPIRFIWNATRGHRLRPWRSEYLKWRIETYSGMKADSLRAKDIFKFVWASRGELLDFLLWTGRLERDVRRKS